MARADIFDRLKQDHDHHRQLIAEMNAAKGDRLRKLFERFRIEVTAHAAAEEETLYATMLARPELRHEAQHSVSEHKEIEDYLEQIADADFGSEAWRENFNRMQKRYVHHIGEEEEEMFPAASEGLSGEKVKELAACFERRKPAELERAKEDQL